MQGGSGSYRCHADSAPLVVAAVSSSGVYKAQPLEYEATYAAGHDLSIPATAKDAPVLDTAKHTTLDGACGPEQAREGGADKENGS